MIALVKCSAELLGMRSLMLDLGKDSSGVIYADSSAALAIAKRKGAGKLRHIHVSSLWIQERQDKGDLRTKATFASTKESPGFRWGTRSTQIPASRGL